MSASPDRQSIESGTENSTIRGTMADYKTELVVSELVTRQVLEARAGADLAALSVIESKIARAVQLSRAPATLKAYRTDWADFTLRCQTHGLDSMPAAPASVAGYVADLAEPADDRKPRAASTIQRSLAAIGEAHKLGGHPNPCLDPLVKQVVKGVRRQIGVAPTHRKAGLSTADITAFDGTRAIDTATKLCCHWGLGRPCAPPNSSPQRG